jgi:Holliday junction resolvase RusA-like endonuclease
MAWAFKPQCKEKYIRMGLKIDFNVGANMDHHNLLKPICDAIELAGIIDNDKHIDDKIIMMPPTRHKRGQPDQITVEIIGGWPAGKSKEENK